MNGQPRWKLGIAVLALAVLIASGCGDDDGAEDSLASTSSGTEQPTGTTGDTSPDTVEQPDTSEPSYNPEGILQYGFDLAVSGGATFDPLLHQGGNALIGPWMAPLYDQIIRFNADGEPVPGLATEWEIPDAQTVELSLREGVVFHDGTPFNADAVKFSLERASENPVWQQSADYAAMTSVEATGDHGVKIHLDQPVAARWIGRVLQDATMTGVVSPTAVEAMGDDFSKAPVGAGPWEFEEFVPDGVLSLRKFDGHWEADDIRLAGIDFVHAAEQARINGLRSGQVAAAAISPSAMETFEGDESLVTVIKSSTYVQYFIMCTSRPPFDDLDVRQAVAHTLDREDFNEKVLNGTGIPTDTFWPEGTQFHAPSLTGMYPRDLDRARELIDGAEVSSTQFRLMASGDQALRAAEVVQAQLNEIGLEAEIAPTAALVQDLFTDKLAEATPLRVGIEAVEFFFLPGLLANWCDYDNPELAEVYNTTKSLLPGDPQLEAAWEDVQARLLEDLLMVPLVAEPLPFVHSDSVGGIDYLDLYGQPNLLDVYIEG